MDIMSSGGPGASPGFYSRDPLGYFVKKGCVVPYTMGICQMCNPGVTYSEYLTGLSRCLTCTRCRADQVEISPCNTTKNTLCQCKEGTYCPPNAPCSQCLPCRSSCPGGQVLLQTCNSSNDNVCFTVTTPPSITTTEIVTQYSAPSWILFIVTTLIILIIFGIYKYIQRSTDHDGSKLEEYERDTKKLLKQQIRSIRLSQAFPLTDNS
ncbi:tumor necrosis factor receptor superfamily member 10A-like isoform X2 [Engystomops pustulosus]|uniref:tumor necrosis factor receptor superfamily member 10A-like isoform X2 n=1 Tax=Engystomops pustulosus TaxID=76066 RepID=UPI003AFADB17